MYALTGPLFERLITPLPAGPTVPPEKITIDGLRSYGAAMDVLGCREKQETGR